MRIDNESAYEKCIMCKGHAPVFINSYINISSENNVIFCEEGVRLSNSSITFLGQGNLIYLSNNCHDYYLNLQTCVNTVFFIDENNYMNGLLNVFVQEHQNVIIGKDGAFSYGIYIRTCDGHLIYDIESGNRINDSRSIFIGDHVWIGQFVTILKGAMIGSGSIIGSNALVTGKELSSNTIYGGNPACEIKNNMFWEKKCPNLFDEKISEVYRSNEDSEWIYKNSNGIDIYRLDNLLKESSDNVNEKFNIISKIRSNKAHDRFAI